MMFFAHSRFLQKWLLSLAFLAGLGGCHKHSESPSLRLAIWSQYASPEVLERFTKKTGTPVIVTHYSSNEELIAKLSAGGAAFDLIVPSDYAVVSLRELGLIQPIDASRVPALKTLDAVVKGRDFDPEFKHSVPFFWGTTGIAVRRDLYTSSTITGWKSFFEAKGLEGHATLLDDLRESLGASLRVGGESINTLDEGALALARDRLKALKPRLRAFTSEPFSELLTGDIRVAGMYSSDALQAREKLGGKAAGKLEYVLPEEGGTLWIDCFALPKSAKNLDAAYAMIRFLSEGETAVENTLAVRAAPANTEVKKLLPLEVQKDELLFPSLEKLKRFELMRDLGTGTAVWDRIWTEVKVSRGA